MWSVISCSRVCPPPLDPAAAERAPLLERSLERALTKAAERALTKALEPELAAAAERGLNRRLDRGFDRGFDILQLSCNAQLFQYELTVEAKSQITHQAMSDRALAI